MSSSRKCDECNTIPLLSKDEDNQVHIVYLRRYWVLFLFSTVSMTQSNNWGTFSTIDAEAVRLYKWDSGVINVLAAWGPISYIPVCLCTPYAVNKIGLSYSVLFASFCTALCCALRCVSFEGTAALYSAHVAQLVNGLAGPFVLATPPLLSAVWFPLEQRTTATVI
jgi:FLVCR family MFS transporter